MSREKELTKNTLIITIGNMCTKFITFFLLPLYTSLLTTTEYGIVDLLNTLVALLLPIVTFQIEKAVFRDLIENRENEQGKKKIISSSIFTVTMQIIIFFVIFLFVSSFIENQYKIFLATNVITFIYNSLALQIARGLGDNKRYAAGSFVTASCTIALNIILLVGINLKVNGLLIGTMVGQIIGTLYIFMYLKLYKYIDIKKYDFKCVKELWKYSFPLIPNALSWWIFSSSDRVIVTSMLGVDQNGILAVSLKFSTIIVTLYNMFDAGWIESVSVHVDDDDIDVYYNKIFNIVLKIFVALCAGMIACMPFIYPIMVDEKFNSGYVLVPISVASTIFNVIVGLVSVIYAAKKDTKAIAVTSGVSSVINICSHLILIKFVGLYAAVISTFLAFFTMSLYRMHDVGKKYFKIHIYKNTIISAIIILGIVLTTYYINNKLLNVLSLIITIIYVFILNRDIVKKIIVILKTKLGKV